MMSRVDKGVTPVIVFYDFSYSYLFKKNLALAGCVPADFLPDLHFCCADKRVTPETCILGDEHESSLHQQTLYLGRMNLVSKKRKTKKRRN